MKPKIVVCSCSRNWLRKSMTSLFGAGLVIGPLNVYAATQVIAWGAGKASDPPDYYNGGQSVVPANLTNAQFVAGGWRNSIALKSGGTLQSWGDDSAGQSDFYPPGQSNYVAVRCGQVHSVALQSNGVPIAAGSNVFGQQDVPPDLSNIVTVAAGFYHSLALRNDGIVVAWGMSTNDVAIGIDPNYGQTRVPGGLSNVVAVAAGGWHSLALKADGTLRAWGRDSSGQAEVPAGISNVIAISAGASHNLALQASGRVVAWGNSVYQQTNVPANLSNVVAIAAGGWHNLALKSDGTVVAWGAGDASVSTSLAYGQNQVPTGLSNVVQIAAGLAHSLALVGNAPPVTKTSLIRPNVSNGKFNVSLPTYFGRVYQLDFQSTLADSNWLARKPASKSSVATRNSAVVSRNPCPTIFPSPLSAAAAPRARRFNPPREALNAATSQRMSTLSIAAIRRSGASKKSSALVVGGVSRIMTSHVGSSLISNTFSTAMYSLVPPTDVETYW
jgi:hypothetical protein